MDIKIRDVDPVAINKIDEYAAAKHMSRNSYLKMYIENLAVSNEVAEIEDKYTNLVNLLSERLEQANDIIAENNYIIEKLSGGHECPPLE